MNPIGKVLSEVRSDFANDLSIEVHSLACGSERNNCYADRGSFNNSRLIGPRFENLKIGGNLIKHQPVSSA